jgi:hypothetical protein
MDKMRTGKQDGGEADGVCVQIVQAQKKPPSSYKYREQGRAGNPTTIFPKDFHVIKSLRLSHEQVQRIEAGDGEARSELKEMLRKAGISGAVRVQLNPGGSGRKGRFEMRCERTSKPRPRQLCKMNIDSDEEDDEPVLFEVDEDE